MCHGSSHNSQTDHIWDYTDDTYIHNLTHLSTLQSRGKIAHLGLTNTDAAHLEMLLDTGFNIATNQVSCSVIDLRAVRGRMSRLCASRGVGLLCYGTLLGGFISEKWLGQPEPEDADALNWSLRKYLRFIQAAGGWAVFQAVLAALDSVASKHGVPIPAVATRWVLDVPAVKAVIVGTRLSVGSEQYIAQNLLAFSFELDDEDRSIIAKAQEGLRDIPGDCGDEYRRPPYLTAAGDLSHHVRETDRGRSVREAVAAGQRVEYLSGSKWEPICVSCKLSRLTLYDADHVPLPGLFPRCPRRFTYPCLRCTYTSDTAMSSRSLLECLPVSPFQAQLSIANTPRQLRTHPSLLCPALVAPPQQARQSGHSIS